MDGMDFMYLIPPLIVLTFGFWLTPLALKREGFAKVCLQKDYRYSI